MPAKQEFDPHVIWQMLLSELSLQMQSATYNTWVRDTWVIAYEDGEFIVGLPNAYARDWLENRLRHKIKRVLGSLIHRSVQVQFRVCPHPVSDSPNAAPVPLYQPSVEPPMPQRITPATKTGPEPSMDEARRALPSAVSGTVHPVERNQTPRPAQNQDFTVKSQLNSHYTFESFVVGSHNKLAHAAAEAIAERPGQSFNPLFVYGGVGLGKTHLLHAIGHRALLLGYRMLYCSSEQFTNELIGAIRNQNTEEFRNKYRQVDILLIDDIQFIAGKESTQEEFFHTFNYLHAGGRQVVLSSDRPPKALATLDDRLRSRFEGGLQTDISQPNFETRVAILQLKANRMNAEVDPSVLMMVAERVDSNIRELEGALNRLIIQARLMNSPLNVHLATSILDNLAPERTPCAPDTLVRLVATHFQLKPEDLRGRKRTKEIANARQIAMFLLREEHALSLPAIGDQLGGRDHSTVRYGIEKVASDLTEDESLRQTITALREKVYLPFAQ
ncbi:MAG: chromosomal replication initiator protein DnaA [Caldilineaceae bacterium]|nr:chromosomal replication initiator protein DnaA [Caldilineaceae bacterium]